MTPRSILELLADTVFLADGAMATELQRAGLSLGAGAELWNVEAPDRVHAVHRAYVEAGATVLLTNTFLGTRIALERHGLDSRTRELNAAAARLARAALGDQRGIVLGDMGPIGLVLEELGATAARSALREQADALLEAGCDGLVVETQTTIAELDLAVSAAKASGAPIVVASLAFDVDELGTVHTTHGVTPERAGAYLRSSGADVVGLNCGARLDLATAAETLAILGKACPQPLYAKPNAGTPEFEDGRIVYRRSVSKMARDLGLLLDAGARIVGGCCGTTPEHIRAFRGALDAKRA